MSEQVILKHPGRGKTIPLVDGETFARSALHYLLSAGIDLPINQFSYSISYEELGDDHSLKVTFTKMEPLGEELERVWDENITELYED